MYSYSKSDEEFVLKYLKYMIYNSLSYVSDCNKESTVFNEWLKEYGKTIDELVTQYAESVYKSIFHLIEKKRYDMYFDKKFFERKSYYIDPLILNSVAHIQRSPVYLEYRKMCFRAERGRYIKNWIVGILSVGSVIYAVSDALKRDKKERLSQQTTNSKT